MATDQRRDRAAEAAAAVNATNNAALSVTAGNLILGALLAPVAEHADQAPHVGANILPGEEAPQEASSTKTSLPSNELIPAPAHAAELSQGADVAAWQPPDPVESISATHEAGTSNPLARLLSELQGDAEFYPAGHGSGPTGEPVGSNDAGPSADAGSAATLHAPTNIVDRLVGDLGHGLEPLLNSLLDMSSVWQQTTSTIDHTVTNLITTIEGLSAAAVLQDLGDTLHTAADRIVQNLELPVLDLPVFELPAPGTEPSMLGLFDDTHSSTIVAGTGAALLDDLPASLLGGPQANPQADGVLAEAFGASVPQSEPVATATIEPAPAEGAHTQTNAFSAFDVESMLVGDTGPVMLGFIGQSYIDAFDAHDVTHHASQSLHGLV